MTEDREENPDVPDRVSAGRDAYVAGRDINIHQERAGGIPRWAAILAAVTVLAVTGVIIALIASARGSGQSPGPGTAEGRLSVRGAPWTVTDGDRREETFTLGEPIQYAFSVYNSTGRTVSANVRFDAYWGARDQGQINIFDTLMQETIPPGWATVRSPPVSVPRDALPGTYTEQADIADRNDPADRGGQYGSFNVVGRTLLTVPYLTKPGNSPPDGPYDGPACVAMVLGSRPGAGQPTVGDVQEFIAANGPGHGAVGAAQPVTGKEMEAALEHYGVPDAAIKPIPLNEQGLPQAQVTDIAVAIKQGSPVIVFADGNDLLAGHAGNPGYTGNWLVVAGFSLDRANGTQVLVNDPDETPGHGGIKGQPISISTFEQALKDTASMPAAQQVPDHVSAIVVMPSRSS
jgi:hypothetical protein